MRARLPHGAQEGNQNARKYKRWEDAIARALAQRSDKLQIDALRELADRLLEACDKGDIAALKELGDRMDGKAKQQVDLTSGDEPIPLLTLDQVKARIG